MAIPWSFASGFLTVITEVFPAPTRRKAMGSSFRYRRLVVAGRVVSDPIALAQPAMRPRETAMLTELLRRADRVLEFGAGGSTTLALKLGVNRLVSVESDASWIERIKADDRAAQAVEDRRLTMLRADIGPIGFMGGPGKGSTRDRWPDYARTPWTQLDTGQLDLILIDGRFRVACILESILRAPPQTIIAVHDFWDRPEYHCVLPFLDLVDRCQTLGVFRVAAELDRAAARTLLEPAGYWPR
jgi:hypothetical protein